MNSNIRVESVSKKKRSCLERVENHKVDKLFQNFSLKGGSCR